MKIKVFYESKFAKLINVLGITLYPFIFMSQNKDYCARNKIIEHEFMHVRQVRKHGWFKFYLTYLYEYFRNRFIGFDSDKAYLEISFEKEAYKSQSVVVLTEEEKQEIL